MKEAKRKQAKEANELIETSEDNNTEEDTNSQGDLKEPIEIDTS